MIDEYLGVMGLTDWAGGDDDDNECLIGGDRN